MVDVDSVMMGEGVIGIPSICVDVISGVERGVLIGLSAIGEAVAGISDRVRLQDAIVNTNAMKEKVSIIVL